jgi:CDP-glycerol glycerophosphotransferase (TagB/SpsB family)
MNRQEVLRHYKLDGSRPVIGYAPTGQKYNSLETMGEEVIAKLKATNQFDILIKPHDHPRREIDWFTRLAPLEDEHTRVVRDADVMPLLFASDLLITDASSVANEYSLLDRPIVYLDVPKLLAKAMEKSPSMDLVTWGRRAGRVVLTPDKVVEAVEESLRDPKGHAPIRRAMAQDLFYNPGGATEAAAKWLIPRLGYSG